MLDRTPIDQADKKRVAVEQALADLDAAVIAYVERLVTEPGPRVYRDRSRLPSVTARAFHL